MLTKRTTVKISNTPAAGRYEAVLGDKRKRERKKLPIKR